MPAPEVFLALEKKMLGGGSKSELKTNKIGEKCYKKTQTRNMSKHKKLVLIQEYYEYSNKYRALNKTKFWVMISNIFK